MWCLNFFCEMVTVKGLVLRAFWLCWEQFDMFALFVIILFCFVNSLGVVMLWETSPLLCWLFVWQWRLSFSYSVSCPPLLHLVTGFEVVRFSSDNKIGTIFYLHEWLIISFRLRFVLFHIYQWLQVRLWWDYFSRRSGNYCSLCMAEAWLCNMVSEVAVVVICCIRNNLLLALIYSLVIVVSALEKCSFLVTADGVRVLYSLLFSTNTILYEY